VAASWPISRSSALLRAALCTVLLVVLAAPAARADTKVTSLRPWAVDNTYLVRVDLDGRTAPRLEPRARVDYLKAGQWVRISCQTTGEEAYGSVVWDKVGSYYVPDHYIKTYTDGFLERAPRCDDDSPPPPPPPQRKRYVAMGDSYSSGEGAGGYMSATRYARYECHRSASAYSQWLAIDNQARIAHSVRRDFVACSGAEAPDVTTHQLPVLDGKVGVVTIGIGGNDANFGEILTRCIVNVRAPCQDFLHARFDLRAVRGRVDALYSQIRRRARQATVIVVGYPRLFTDVRRCGIGVFRAERVALNRAADQLNATIASVARRHRFRFVDPRAAFAGRGLCSDPARRWMKPYVPGEPVESFHPNADGQRALANLIAAANPDIFG